MTLQYQAVGWNRSKRRIDGCMLLGVLGYLVLFLGLGTALHPDAPAETHLIRALGSAAFLLLHVVLCIGPLCRLDHRWLPLLYNRRHLGVCMFGLALLHGAFCIVYFHGFGDTNPLLSVFTANPRWDSVAQFPFQPLGFVALVIFCLMAATSHDFWLANLTAPVWKALHMLVYLAYALVLLHVLAGAVQGNDTPWLLVLTALGFACVLGLHMLAGAREAARDTPADPADPAEPAERTARAARGDTHRVDVGAVADIPEGRAITAVLSGERVAIFRSEGRLFAVSAVCQHQNGPLGEGRLLDGCIVCPWHGYQYLPDCGRSPPPFTEAIPTFGVAVVDGRVLVDPTPKPSGTYVEPARVDGPGPPPDDGDFFVGYLPAPPAALARHTRRVAWQLLAGAWVVGVSLVLAERPFAASRFEFGHPREFSGRIVLSPHPTLVLDGPSAHRALLVSEFKWGAGPALAGFDGAHVQLAGTLAYRDDKLLLEMVPGSVRRTAPPADSSEPRPVESPPSTVVDLGTHTLRGEIVDSKCFLGVMNPGNLKLHRACAARCISGGIPPVLVVRDRHGVASQLVLVGSAGTMVNREVLAMIAEPVEITGRVERHDDLLFLFAEPETYRRLTDG